MLWVIILCSFLVILVCFLMSVCWVFFRVLCFFLCVSLVVILIWVVIRVVIRNIVEVMEVVMIRLVVVLVDDFGRVIMLGCSSGVRSEVIVLRMRVNVLSFVLCRKVIMLMNRMKMRRVGIDYGYGDCMVCFGMMMSGSRRVLVVNSVMVCCGWEMVSSGVV